MYDTVALTNDSESRKENMFWTFVSVQRACVSWRLCGAQHEHTKSRDKHQLERIKNLYYLPVAAVRKNKIFITCHCLHVYNDWNKNYLFAANAAVRANIICAMLCVKHCLVERRQQVWRRYTRYFFLQIGWKLQVAMWSLRCMSLRSWVWYCVNFMPKYGRKME